MRAIDTVNPPSSIEAQWTIWERALWHDRHDGVPLRKLATKYLCSHHQVTLVTNHLAVEAFLAERIATPPVTQFNLMQCIVAAKHILGRWPSSREWRVLALRPSVDAFEGAFGGLEGPVECARSQWNCVSAEGIGR